MKTTTLLLSSLLLFTINIAKAQVQTIVVPANAAVTNSSFVGGLLTVPAGNYAKLLSLIGPGAEVQISYPGMSITLNDNYLTSLANTPVVFAGPVTIQVLQSSSYTPAGSFATFDIEPAPFPPNKTATIGANTGNVQVTMQVSTDLVNWTTAVNGQTYTNSPDARFFRIQMLTNVGP